MATPLNFRSQVIADSYVVVHEIMGASKNTIETPDYGTFCQGSAKLHNKAIVC